MSEAEIITAIEEYNTIEAAQAARLLAIFQAIKARQNYRAVRFPGFNWTNCWTGLDRLDNRTFIEPHSRRIVSYDLGIE